MITRFECRACSYSSEHIETGEAPNQCPDCESKWYRLRFCKEPKREAELVTIACTMESRPRYSMALGVAPDQIEEARKIHPDAEFNKRGDMLIKNRADKKRRMKERGFVEFE